MTTTKSHLIRSAADLEAIRTAGALELAIREARAAFLAGEPEVHLLVCGAAHCQVGGSGQLEQALGTCIAQYEMEHWVKVRQVGCFGFCRKGPVVGVYPGSTYYRDVQPEDVAEIILGHVIGGKPVQRLLYVPTPAEKSRASSLAGLALSQGKRRIALKNCGLIDPEDIREAIAADRWFALAKALQELTPAQAAAELKQAGLRFRGNGAPLGLTVAIQTDTDRTVLEGDPHALLEAICLAGYAAGARQGYIHLQEAHPVAVQRLSTAIRQAREYGLLGAGILGSAFSFDVELRLGAQAAPWARPALANSAELCATIPAHILNGSGSLTAPTPAAIPIGSLRDLVRVPRSAPRRVAATRQA